ncbi:MAG: hypothetical protein K9I94_11165 [Bacteroidales bacterium]|nr:hypothetical protein [Bacteroidales bacterium]
MKKHALLLSIVVLIIFTNNNATSQTIDWNEVNSNTSSTLYSVSYTGGISAIATGISGVIVYSDDSGGTWTMANSGVTSSLWGSFMVNNNLAFAVGSGGTILKTTDGGETWSQKTSGTIMTLYDVFFIDELTGWAVGVSESVLYTEDGGETWEILSSGSAQSYWGVHFLDADVGYAVGTYGTLKKTNDGGNTWQEIGNPPTENLYDVHFIDDNTGFIAGHAGTLLQTDDGGQTWENYDIPGNISLRSIDFIASIGIAVGNGGAILTTQSAGEVWNIDYSPFTGQLWDAVVNYSYSFYCGGGGQLFRGTMWFVPWIELESGFQFVSSRMEQPNPDMLNVCGPLLDELDYVRNSDGAMLHKVGDEWVNNIGDWNVLEGYLFKMSAESGFSLGGEIIDPSTPIPLEAGYQFVTYLNAGNMDALVAFESILNNNLDFIRDSEGKMIFKLGDQWINTIGETKPNEGYLIRMNGPDTLIYPSK